MDHTNAVIMAGGIGTRFWPKSREEKPKQYLSLIEESTLIQATASRLLGLINKKKIFIVSTLKQKQLINDQLPWIPDEQLFFEPFGRNTAPAVGLAALQLYAQDPEAVMIILPADHQILDTKHFLKILSRAVKYVSENPEYLITLGIQPHYPATGYGYIETDKELEKNLFQVKQFTEKPNRTTAKEFLATNRFFWNAGIFIWKAVTILEKFQKHMPDFYSELQKLLEKIDTPDFQQACEVMYNNIDSQSIDYGIMEKAQNVCTIRSDFGWNDVGSWQEVYNSSKKDENGNVIKGEPLLKDVKNCYIETSDRTVSVLGVEDFVIVDMPDALLIARQDYSQDVRWVVKNLDPNKK